MKSINVNPMLALSIMLPAVFIFISDIETTAKQRLSAQKSRVRLSSDEAAGKNLFSANGCFDCHSINGIGCSEGVSLSSVGLRRSYSFIYGQIQDPERHVDSNQKAFNGETNLMANPNLTADEIKLVVKYLQTLRKKIPAKGVRAEYYNTY